MPNETTTYDIFWTQHMHDARKQHLYIYMYIVYTNRHLPTSQRRHTHTACLCRPTLWSWQRNARHRVYTVYCCSLRLSWPTFVRVARSAKRMHTKNDCAIEVQTARRLVFFLWSKNDGWIQDCESVWGMNSWVCLIFTGFFFVYQHCWGSTHIRMLSGNSNRNDDI